MWYIITFSLAYTSQVHFDCMYRGITAVSSRESKLLAGNRSIAQVLTFDFVCVWSVRERAQLLLIKTNS